jgi:predicted nuclease of predicted toxin-antitoxin system
VRVFIDENLSPALARALNALFVGDHEVVHIREKFGPKVEDEDWIARLSAERRWVVISGDSSITKRRAQQAAFRIRA